jgi:hypothetical protein
MATVVTHRAEPMPRRPPLLDRKPKRRLLNGQGVASAAHNACASLSLATSETWASGAEGDAKALRRTLHRPWEPSAVQPYYDTQYYC